MLLYVHVSGRQGNINVATERRNDYQSQGTNRHLTIRGLSQMRVHEDMKWAAADG